VIPLLSAKKLRVHFPVRAGLFRRIQGNVQAVDGVELEVLRGETHAVVGESGSGKSTLGRALLRLGPVTSGTLRWEETDLLGLDAKALRTFRRRAQMVFQDPFASLNPRHSAGYLLAEPMKIHGLARGNELRERIQTLLESVGLSAGDASKFPHQFSGGQRQRLAIARALAVRPELIVADEPVSALDMSVQAQVLGLMEDLKTKLGLTYVFISHDLGVVRRISDRISVMYLGHIVEKRKTREFFQGPLHPYSEALLAASSTDKKAMPLTGEIPSPMAPPPGCPFQTRCPKTMDICRREFPPWVAKDGGETACWLHN